MILVRHTWYLRKPLFCFWNIIKVVKKKLHIPYESATLLGMFRLSLAHLLTIIAISLSITACKRESNVSKANRDGILLIGNGAEPESLDPQLATGVTEGRIIDALFEGLIGEDPTTLQPTPNALAKSWDISSDGLIYTFKLRDNATWNNEAKDPVTAHDFVYSYHRILNPDLAAKNSYMLYPMKNAEAYNKNLRGQILFKLAKDTPLAWENIKSVPFSGDKLITMPEGIDKSDPASISDADFKTLSLKLGLNSMSKTLLEHIRESPSRFPWPSNVSKETQTIILDRLIEFSEKDLWEHANVGVAALDDHSLQLTLRGPTPYLLGVLQHMSWYPVHPATIEKYGGMTNIGSQWTRLGNLVGNGPFTLQEWRLNAHISVSKSPSYWDFKNVKLNGIKYLPIDNVETEQRAFRKEALHITSTVPPHRTVWAKKHLPEQLHIDPYLGVYYYRINLNPPKDSDDERTKAAREMLSDVRVRKALALAINREDICAFLKAGQKPATSFCPPGAGNYQPAYQLTPPQASHEDRIKEAKQLLSEAGYSDDLSSAPEIQIFYNTSESHRQLAELIQSQWKKNLGLKCTLYNQEWKIYQATIQDQKYDIARAGWIGDYNDPNTFMDLWLSGAGNNQTGFSNKRYDELIGLAAKTNNPEKRLAYFQEAETILLTELPIIPLYFYVSQKMIHPSLKGHNANILDRLMYKNFQLED